ncbi:hypothetical protein, partial [Bradyrhizobium sp. NAS96.2]|uniref:hypothetical protein n=1 Tax=Bradyrhizobium sp. NAS96.2 TaxID=1680160 RepID=UPI001160EDB7
MRACVALVSQRDAAAVAQDEAAVRAATRAALRAGVAEHDAQPLARRAVPADARPGVAQASVAQAVAVH